MHSNIPPNQIFSFRPQLNVFREVKRLPPIDDLSVGIMGILGTERGPTDLTFKHDCTKRPPVTILSIAMATENLRSDVIWSTNSGVRHNSSRLSPVIDDPSITNSEIDLVEIY